MNPPSPAKPLEISWFAFLFLPAVLLGTEIVALLLMEFCPSITDTALSTAACYGTMLIVLAAYMLLHKRSFHEIGFRTICGADALRSFFLGFLLQPGAMMISYISSFFFTDIVTDSVDTMISETPLPLLILCSAVIPALFEETAARGVILFGYHKSLPTWALILFPSLIFGFMHGNATQFLYAAVLGCVFSLMDLRTDSIFPSMISHFTLNASQVLLAAWAGAVESSGAAVVPDTADAYAFDPEALLLYLILTAATVPPIILCLKRMKNSHAPSEYLTSVTSEKPPHKLPPFRDMLPLYLALLTGLLTLVLFEIAMRFTR